MKKLLQTLIAFLYLLAINLVNASSKVDFSAPFQLPNPVSKTVNSINFIISPQVELISIVQSISNYPSVFDFLMQSDSFQYKQEVLHRFTQSKEHPVIQLFEKLSMRPGKLNFSAPSNIMLYADEHLELRTDQQNDDFVFSRIGGKDTLLLFLGLLKDFAVTSSFNEFFESHTIYYKKLVSNTINELDSLNYISELETFYGVKQKSYNIVLVSLYSHVGFGNSIVDKNWKREIFDTMGPQKIRNRIPFFGDNNYFKYITRHEFSHPFVNPLTEKYWDSVKEHFKNYDSIPEVAKNNVCGDWQECINEFVIRAITVYLATNESKELGLQAHEEEKSRGVSYLDPLLKQIRYYQSNRSTYPTLESYYLELLRFFKN